MKTKHLFALCTVCILTAIPAYAQQKAGTLAITPKAGLTVSNVTGNIPATIHHMAVNPAYLSALSTAGFVLSSSEDIVASSYLFTENKPKVGFAGGVEAQYQFTKLFGLSLGTMYILQGATYRNDGLSSDIGNFGQIHINDDLKTNLHTIAIPILANAYVWRGLAIKAGLQAEFAIGKKLKVDMSTSIGEQTAHVSSIDIKNIRSFALSIPVGISYEFKNIVADWRYHIGLTNIAENNNADYFQSDYSTGHNSTLSLTVGYKFEL